MNERIKRLRRALDLTQQEFAERIGVKRNTIANYEIGRNAPIDSVLSLIVREFNVNEAWLRTGEGSMFRPMARSDEVAEFVNRVCSDDPETFRSRLIHALSQLNADQWAAAERFARSLVADRLPSPADDIETKVAAYRAELEAQQRGMEGSSALPTEKDA